MCWNMGFRLVVYCMFFFQFQRHYRPSTGTSRYRPLIIHLKRSTISQAMMPSLVIVDPKLGEQHV